MSSRKSDVPLTHKRLTLWVFAGFTVFGGLLTIASAIWLYDRIDYARHSIKVTATIINLEKRPNLKGPPTRVPTFRFKDTEGAVRIIKSQASYAEGMQAGRTLRLIYNPREEEGLLIDQFSSIYGPPLFLASFGVIWTTLSILGIRNVLQYHQRSITGTPLRSLVVPTRGAP